MLKQAIFTAFAVIVMAASIAISPVSLMQQALAFTNDGEEINAHPYFNEKKKNSPNQGNSGSSANSGSSGGNSTSQGIGQSQKN